jgi:hypothetical protein
LYFMIGAVYKSAEAYYNYSWLSYIVLDDWCCV